MKLDSFATVRKATDSSRLGHNYRYEACPHLSGDRQAVGLPFPFQCRYNPEAYASFEKLHVPIVQDNDEWDHYHSVKKDPVVHVEVGELVRADLQMRKEGDLLAIVPLTANTLAKMTTGICDNLLTSTYRAWGRSKPIVVCTTNNSLFTRSLRA